MLLEILIPDKKVFESEVSSVALPGASGAFEILNNHAALVSILEKGRVIIKAKGVPNTEYSISGGVVEVLNNKVLVLAENIY